MKQKYKRVLVKISGEMFSSKDGFGIDFDAIKTVADEIKSIHSLGVDVAVVIGAGNIFRGRSVCNNEIDNATADYMGMISTMLNALAFQGVLEQSKMDTRVLSAITMIEVAEPYIRRRGLRHLEKRRVVILASGSGNPYFTTDTASVLRALELNCDIILKMTKVDGVYSSDPMKDRAAKKYDKLSFKDALLKNLKVMDSTAFALCMNNNLPIKIFKFKKGNLKKVVNGG